MAPAALIDGKAIAAALRRTVAAEVAGLAFQPTLAVVLVGDDPASAVYVRAKDRAAREAGLAARTHRLGSDTDAATLLALIDRLNRDASVDGILVQLPLPRHLDARAVIRAIDPAKDVDGLHPVNAGLLVEGAATLVPCTPKGVIKLLDAIGTPLAGARAIVVGRSALVGKPVAQLLTHRDATVTLAHSRTRDLAAECRRAEVLVAAVGRPMLVQGDWIRHGAIVIDVGINRAPDGTLVGDVAYPEVAARAAAITPVPGGVGPMTIACLLENTLVAACARRT